MKKQEYDYIVVGAGAAGAATAWRLVDKGFSVALLDRGKEMDPQHYPSTGSNWELRKQTDFNPVSAVRNLPSDYPIDDSNSPIAVCNFNAIGGSTILFSGHFPRFLKRDFNLKTMDGLHEDWPIEYDNLIPYFELNEKEMSVSGLVGDPMYPEIESLLPPVPIGHAGTKIAEAFNQHNWHWWPSYSAISTRERNGRAACINLGPCNTGCPQGAKSSVDVTYIAKAKKKGLTVFPECAVSSVIVENKQAKGVKYFDSEGKLQALYSRRTILAASAIGTPQILLNSEAENGSKGIANSSGLVGRNLMIHPLGYTEGLFENEIDVDVGPQGCLIYSLEHYRNPNEQFQLGYMMHVLRGTGPVEASKSAFSRRKLRFGANLTEDFQRFYKKQLSISIICDDLPNPDNRVQLSDKKDRFGIPGVMIKYRVSDNTQKMMNHGMTQAKKILKSAGASKTYAFGPVRNSGWHLMGTCKMGTNSKNSVVNEMGECHDVSGLFITDSSCFVSGSCVNPANTIQTLALYLTDKIVEFDEHAA